MIENHIIEFISRYLDGNELICYIVFGIISFIQMIFPPLPGDFFLIFQGYLACKSANYNVFIIFGITYCSTFLGSIVVYKTGYKYGASVLENRFIRKFVSKKRINKANKLFKKFGYIAIILSKFLLGVSSVVILFSGIFKVKPKYAYMAIGSSIFLHHIFYIFSGNLLCMKSENIKTFFSTYNKIIIYITLFIGIIFIGYIMRRNIKLVIKKIFKLKI